MIWIIGGTINAREILSILVSSGYACILTITTETGRQLSELSGAEVIQGVLNEQQMVGFIRLKEIKLVIDASHPFAAEVSQNAINSSNISKITYLRFERLNPEYADVIKVRDYEMAIKYLTETSGNILLTIGSKNIEKFIPLGVERLYVRVLSSCSSISICEKVGLKSTHIIGMSGVCSTDLNLAILQEYRIKFLVTKASGNEGGINEKIAAARLANAEVIIIQRPTVNYPEMFTDYDTLINRTKEIYI